METSGPELQRLLAAVYADPDDDAPRLVLSDWLQERGDPLGEFIALQLAGHPEALDRARGLLGQHRRRWCEPLGGVAPRSVRFERGFPGLVGLDATEHAAPLARPPSRAWATVRRMELEVQRAESTPPNHAGWLSSLDWLHELRAPAEVLRLLAYEGASLPRLVRIEAADPSASSAGVLARSAFGRHARVVEAISTGRWRVRLRHQVAEAPWRVEIDLLGLTAREEVLSFLEEVAARSLVAEVRLATPALRPAQADLFEARLARFPRWSVEPLPQDDE